MYTKLMSKRNAAIKQMYAEGLSVSFIAEQWQMKPREVRAVLAGRKQAQRLVIEVTLE
jgi:DNA-binding NarL/FixJ family response regulator